MPVRLLARISYMNIKLALIIVTLPCLVAGVFSFVGWRHEYFLRQLEQHGQEVQAVVTDSNPAGGSGRRPIPAQLVYQFSFDGHTYASDSFVSDAVQQHTRPGDHIAVRFLPEAPDVSKPIGLPKIFLEVGSHTGLIIATAYTVFGLCFFCFAHWRLRQMESKHHAKRAA